MKQCERHPGLAQATVCSWAGGPRANYQNINRKSGRQGNILLAKFGIFLQFKDDCEDFRPSDQELYRSKDPGCS